jgi:hypothetical protein
MLENARLLVAIVWGEERAGVRRTDDGHCWISHWRAANPHRVAGTRLRGRQPGQILVEDQSATGGVLIARASAVEVLGVDERWRNATIGDGAWVAVVPHGPPCSPQRLGLPPVRFVDRSGAIVSRAASHPQKGRRRLDRVASDRLAGEHSWVGGVCPACGTNDWDSVPAPPERGTGDIVFCAACGQTDGAHRSFYGPLIA